MKKFLYIFLAAALSVAAASCSDDDNGNGGDNGGDNGGEGGGKAMVKTLTITDAGGDSQTVTLTRDADGKVTAFSDGDVNCTVSYAAGKATVKESATDYVEYTLDANGYATHSDSYVSDAEGPYLETALDYTYNAGLVTHIYEDDYDYFTATLSGKNWAACAGQSFGGTCVASSTANNEEVDLNMLVFRLIDDSDTAILYANLCGLLPSTQNLLSSVTAEGGDDGEEEEAASVSDTRAETIKLDFVPTVDKDGNITELKVNMGATPYLTVKLGY